MMGRKEVSGKVELGVVVGLLIGAVGGYVAAKSHAGAEVKEAQGYQVELAQKNAELEIDNLSLERRVKRLENSAYDRQEIISCMLDSTTRSNAIRVYLDGGVMGVIQEAKFQPLVPVALKSSRYSYQSRWSGLMEEALKLDHECLDQAMIELGLQDGQNPM